MSAEGLHQHIEQLSIILMQPWLSAKWFDVIRGDVGNLVDILHSYRKYLTSKWQKMKLHQQYEATPVEEEKNLACGITCAKVYIITVCDLEQKLMDLPLYQLLLLLWTTLNAGSGNLEYLFHFLLCSSMPMAIMLEHWYMYGESLKMSVLILP